MSSGEMNEAPTRTQVGIIGAGPAGLLIGNLLLQAGVDCVDCIIVERHSRDYIEHLTRYVYPQQELVKDLVASFLKAGGDLRFEATALEVSAPTTTPTIHTATGEIVCDLVAGCDGFYGVTRSSLPATAFTIYEKQHAFRWLVLLAGAPPRTDQIIYALDEREFAGHMLRSSTVSRFYLQCSIGDILDKWPDERIWSELETRLALQEPWSLTPGPILEKSFLVLRNFVCDPMQYGPVYLAGDAAHILSLAAGKGMNLAFANAAVFVEVVRAFYEHDDYTLLASYSQRCLPRIWRTQEFSHRMLSIMYPPVQPDAQFLHRLQIARLERLATSRAAAASFAEDYIGADFAAEESLYETSA